MWKRKTGIIIILIILALFTGGAFAAQQLFNNWTGPDAESGQSKAPGRFNVLLLGSDARPGEKLGNTDTIIVAQIDRERLSLLSIPRDTRVEIPGQGMNKINAACRYGGPELTARVVSDLIGVPVEKYALVRWSGFMKIVDTLGGVDIYVPRNMHYDPQEGPEYKIDLHKGHQHLNGRQALAFVRFRMEARGDIDRTEQQLEFMKALADKVKQPATLLKLPVLLPELYKNVDTNMSLGEVLAMAKAGYDLKNIAVVTQTLPGYFLTVNGLSYWGVDPEQARRVAADLFEYGLTTKQVVLETPPHLRSNEKPLTRIAQKPLEIELKEPASPEGDASSPANGNTENQPEAGSDSGTVDNPVDIPPNSVGNPQAPGGGEQNLQPVVPPRGGSEQPVLPQQPGT
ncbi:MAG TPA: LCP family protein [Syntrophomonadaceae bacterium]|nr:LCP family protein [Syntrophomonadaceae bacterium]